MATKKLQILGSFGSGGSSGSSVYIDDSLTMSGAAADSKAVGDRFNCVAIVTVGEEIPSGADLNNYTTPGTYRSGSGTISASLSNTPYTGTGFKLEVFNTTSENQIIQEIKCNAGSARVYRRQATKSNDVWTFGSWYKVMQSASDALAISDGGTGLTKARDVQSYFMNSYSVGFDQDIATLDVLSLPPGIYHHEAATSTEHNYPISATRAMIEVIGQYRAGTAATDGYPNGYWAVRVTYPYSGEEYWNHRTWSSWTGWRKSYNSTVKPTTTDIGAVAKSGDTMTGTLYTTHTTGLAIGDATTPERISIIRISSDTANRFAFRQYGTNGNRENFNLPNTTEPTENVNYNILTSKNPVTIAQGGTGATTARAAEYNICNGMAESTVAITDSSWMVFKLNSSASTTNGALTYKTADLLWTYIKGKSNATYLPLAGGTMTGTITLASGGLKTSNTSGYTLNQYGNFVHQIDTANNNWAICNSANTAKFQVWFETGAVTAQGKITAPCFGGNGIRYSSTQPTSNLVTGQIWLKPV